MEALLKINKKKLKKLKERTYGSSYTQQENSSSNKDKVTIGLAEPTNPKTNARIESLKRISNKELSNLRPYLCKKVQISGFA